MRHKSFLLFFSSFIILFSSTLPCNSSCSPRQKIALQPLMANLSPDELSDLPCTPARGWEGFAVAHLLPAGRRRLVPEIGRLCQSVTLILG